jgi:ABC-2 type transport system permease protein
MKRLLTKLRAELRTGLTAADTAIREKLAFRANFAGSMLTYGLFILVFSRIWASATAGGTTIAGYSYNMLVWYFIIAEVPSFALGRFFWTLARDMKSGQVAYLVSRPYDFVGYQYWERLGSALPDLFIILGEGLLIGCLLTGGLPSLADWAGAPSGGQPLASSGLAWLTGQGLRALLVFVSLLLSGSLNFYLQFSLAMTAFWLEENDAFYWIFQKLALVVGTLIPIELLPATARSIAVWTPFPYIAYAPARIMVAFRLPEALRLMAVQLIWIAIGLVLARLVFAAGSRKLSINGG